MRKTKLNLSKLTSKNTVEDPIKAFKQAQMKLMTLDPFIATVMFNLHHRYSKEIPTAGTTGTYVHYNEQFFMRLSKAERIFLIAHEVWHVVFKHTDPDRIKNRDRTLWNMAGDLAINYILKENKIGSMPAHGLYNQALAGLSTEQIYDKLKNEGDKNTLELRQDANPIGNDVIPTPLSPEDDMKITQAIVKAAQQVSGKEAGSLPDYVKEMINKILQPQHNWKQQLREFINARTRNDYAWSRPNRRTDPDIYMPSLYSETPESLVIAIDTSGSIRQTELVSFLTEIKSIHEDVRPLNTHIIMVDTEVHAPQHFTEWDTIPTNMEAHGRGGTEFQPAFDWADDKNPACFIYLTDLYASDPKPPAYPTLWVSTTKGKKGPFGRTIHLDA